MAFIELEDYLALETASRYRHEYLDGVIYAIQGEPVRGMAGGSQVHARIIRNAAFALHALVRPPTATGHLRTPAKPKTASSPSNKRGSAPSLTPATPTCVMHRGSGLL